MSPLPALFQLTSIAFTPELQRARQEAALKGNETKAKEVAWTNFPKDLMVGALMGGVAHTVVAPVERAKLLLQTQDSNMVVMDGKHPRYKGLLDCIVRIAKNEGVLSLWRGNIWATSSCRWAPRSSASAATTPRMPRKWALLFPRFLLSFPRRNHRPSASCPSANPSYRDFVQFLMNFRDWDLLNFSEP